MLYYPSKIEIYSFLLKKYLQKKYEGRVLNEIYKQKLQTVKLFEAVFSKGLYEPTVLGDFIDNLFLRIEAVLYSKGKKITLSREGNGNFFIDRRLLLYLFLELCSKGDNISVIIRNKMLIIYGDILMSSHIKCIIKKLGANIIYCGKNQYIVALLLKKAKGDCAFIRNPIDCLENKYSPEYIWL